MRRGPFSFGMVESESSATSAPSVVIALGSNMGDRLVALRRAVSLMSGTVRVVRLSRVWETEPIECEPDTRPFLNMVALGWTVASASVLLTRLLAIEAALGRRRGRPNERRTIDLDLILYGAHLIREEGLRVPHPRFTERNFVLAPLRELDLDWVVPGTGQPLRKGSGKGRVRPFSRLY